MRKEELERQNRDLFAEVTESNKIVKHLKE